MMSTTRCRSYDLEMKDLREGVARVLGELTQTGAGASAAARRAILPHVRSPHAWWGFSRLVQITVMIN